MTTDSIKSSRADANEILRGELLDAFTEVVVHARGPAARAAVISELIQEMCATVEWLHRSVSERDDSQADELSSITRLAGAAQDHQRQMNACKHKVEWTTLGEALRVGPELLARREGNPAVTHAPGLPNDVRRRAGDTRAGSANQGQDTDPQRGSRALTACECAGFAGRESVAGNEFGVARRLCSN